MFFSMLLSFGVLSLLAELFGVARPFRAQWLSESQRREPRWR
jgi:hypothetical protein